MILKIFGTFFLLKKPNLVWTFIFNFFTYLCIFYMWTRSTIQAVNCQATVQVFYLQQNHAWLSWPRGARRQNFCCLGMNNRKFLLLSLIKSNFLSILLFIIHLLGERLLMHIVFGRGLTIWSMIIATMVTLSQLLGNLISTNINQ